MARIGIVFGLLLFGLTIAGLSVTVHKSYTQFMPMMFGIPMLFLGIVALNPHRRGDSMFAGLILMLVGMVLGGGRMLVLTVSWLAGEHVNLLSYQLVAAMTVVCGIFVIAAERWRRSRRRAEKERLLSKPIPPLTTVENPPPEPSEAVTRVTVDNENPYQPTSLLNEPASNSSNQPTDPSTK